MDRDQHELQHLGFFGIWKQSFKLTFSWRKIFSHITLALILPISVLSLVNYQISDALFSKFNEIDNTTKISGSEWAGYLLFQFGYAVVLITLSLLANAAVIFTISAIFAAKELTFKSVSKAVPRVWLRLALTFLAFFILIFAYNVIAIIILVVWFIVLPRSTAWLVFTVVLLIAYLAGLIYAWIIYSMASVVTILEDLKAFKALKKGKFLIKGKTLVSVFLFVVINVCAVGVDLLYRFVVFGGGAVLGVKIVVGVVAVLLLTVVLLLGTVAGTVLYFVCKSHHREEIDKSLLRDHLEVYVYGNLRRPNV